jgi:uncharacterized membrane protein (GlpM family)
MSRSPRTHTKHTKTPEYIQLQPYRALVGVPVKGRSGMVQAFIVGVIKGLMWAIVPSLLIVVAYVYWTEGLGALRADVLSHVVWAAVLAGTMGLMAGMLSAARR